VERVTTIEASSGKRQGVPIRGLLFVLAHYQALLKTITQTPRCILPFLIGNTHIMGPMSEVIRAFDHLLTQLALIGLKVKVSKYKLWNPLKIFLGIEIPQGYTLVLDGLCILGVLMGTQDFATHFLDKVLS